MRLNDFPWLTWPGVISIIISLLAGCSGSADTTPELDRAEAIIDSAPDSALVILEAVTTDSTSALPLRARHALLLSKAYDKNYIDLTDDSLINIAEDYYSRSGNDRERMLTYFYKGRVQYNASNYDGAMASFLLAEKYARKLGDNFYLGMTYRAFKNIYSLFYYGKEELDNSRMSLEAFIAHGDSSHIIDALLELHCVLNNNELYEESLAGMDDILVYGKRKGDYDVIDGVHRIRGTSLFGMGRHREAVTELECIARRDTSALWPDDLNAMARLYDILGETEKRDRIISLIDTTSGKALIPYQIYARKKDWKKAYEYLLVFTDSIDHILWGMQHRKISHAAKSFADSELAVKEDELSKSWMRFWLAVAVITGLSGITFLSIRNYRIRERNLVLENENFTTRISSLRDELAVGEKKLMEAAARSDASVAENELLRDRLRGFISRRYSEINDLCSNLYEVTDNSKGQKAAMAGLRRIVKEFSDGGKYLAEIESDIDLCCDNLISRLREEKSLSPDDIRLTTYLIAGFTARSISLFLDMDINRIYLRKHRLKEKLRKAGSFTSRRAQEMI